MVIVPGTMLAMAAACNSWSALWREHDREEGGGIMSGTFVRKQEVSGEGYRGFLERLSQEISGLSGYLLEGGVAPLRSPSLESNTARTRWGWEKIRSACRSG